MWHRQTYLQIPTSAISLRLLLTCPDSTTLLHCHHGATQCAAYGMLHRNTFNHHSHMCHSSALVETLQPWLSAVSSLLPAHLCKQACLLVQLITPTHQKARGLPHVLSQPATPGLLPQVSARFTAHLTSFAQSQRTART